MVFVSSALANSKEEKANMFANCAAVFAVSARSVEVGALAEQSAEQKDEATKMLDSMGARSFTLAVKYAKQAMVETKFKSYQAMYTERVNKEGNTSALGSQLEPCKTVVNSSK